MQNAGRSTGNGCCRSVSRKSEPRCSSSKKDCRTARLTVWYVVTLSLGDIQPDKRGGIYPKGVSTEQWHGTLI